MAELVERWPGAVGAGDRAQRVAGADRPGRHGARAHGRLGLGVRARPAARPRSPSGCAPRVRRAAAPLRARAAAGGRRGAAAASPRLGRRRRTTSGPRAIASTIDGRKAARKCAKSGQFEPRQRAWHPPDLIHFPCLAKPAFCRHFLLYGEDPGKGRILGQGHHRARRPRAGPSAPGHVHRLDRPARPPPPRRGDRRQLRRRGARGLQRLDRDHDPPGQLGHGASIAAGASRST